MCEDFGEMLMEEKWTLEYRLLEYWRKENKEFAKTNELVKVSDQENLQSVVEICVSSQIPRKKLAIF